MESLCIKVGLILIISIGVAILLGKEGHRANSVSKSIQTPRTTSEDKKAA